MPYDKYDKYYGKGEKPLSWKMPAENVVKASKKADESLNKFNKTAEEIHIDYAAAEQQILNNLPGASEGLKWSNLTVKQAGEVGEQAGKYAAAAKKGMSKAEKRVALFEAYNGGIAHTGNIEPMIVPGVEKTFQGALDGQLFPVDSNAEPVPEELCPNFQAHRATDMLVWYPRNTQGEGYNDNTAALDPIDHFNIQDLLARFFIQTHAQWGAITNWRANCIGITSYCFGHKATAHPGGAHMPIFDYDGRNVKTQIRKDVKALQKEHGLGDAWVYETRRGFHVYFLTDMVCRDDYWVMLEKVQCCKGFKRSARHRGYAILRVSAKYTDFDIKLLYVLAAKDGKLRRLSRKAHTIQALIGLGQECGTHFASMFPAWAHFQQDSKEWKPSPRKATAKRIKKAKKNHSYNDTYNEMINKRKAQLESIQSADEPPTSASTITFTATTTDSTWINSENDSGTGGTF